MPCSDRRKPGQRRGCRLPTRQNAILPRLRRIEQKLNEKMLPLFDDKLFVAFDNPVADDKEYGFKKTAES